MDEDAAPPYPMVDEIYALPQRVIRCAASAGSGGHLGRSLDATAIIAMIAMVCRSSILPCDTRKSLLMGANDTDDAMGFAIIRPDAQWDHCPAHDSLQPRAGTLAMRKLGRRAACVSFAPVSCGCQ